MARITLVDTTAAVNNAKAKYNKSKKELMTLPEAWDKIFTMKNNPKDLEKLMEVHEMMTNNLLGREEKSVGKNFTKAEALRLYSTVKTLQRAEKLKSLAEKDLELYPLLNTAFLLEQLVARVKKSGRDYLSLDVETEGNAGGVDIYKERITGWSITFYDEFGKRQNGYIPMLHLVIDEITGEPIEPHTLDIANAPYEVAIWALREIALMAHQKVYHNASFDLGVCREDLKINFKGTIHDTLVIMKLLNENLMDYKLKSLVTKFLGDDSDTYEEMFGKNKKFSHVPIPIARWYAAKDTKVTLDLFEWQWRKLETPAFARIKKVYEKIEQPVIYETFEMENVGFGIDMVEVEKQRIEAERDIVTLERKLKKSFGDINFGSFQQLQKALYYDRDLSVYIFGKTIHKGEEIHMEDGTVYNETSGWRMSPSGAMAFGKYPRDTEGSFKNVEGELVWEPINKKFPTDAESLKKLAVHSEDIQDLMDYRDTKKHLSSFVEKVPELISPDGRLHGQFNSVGTVTLRFSSRNPNLQNQPYKARKMFVAPKGQLILSADFS